MKNLLLVVVMSCLFCSCYSTLNIAGTGASKSEVVKKKQWYALWGLVQINHVDPKELVGDAGNYSVKTEFTFNDVLLNIFTSLISIESKTVTIIK
jgi:hypothetical protein